MQPLPRWGLGVKHTGCLELEFAAEGAAVGERDDLSSILSGGLSHNVVVKLSGKVRKNQSHGPAAHR